MSKTVYLQVFMDPEKYLEFIKEAKAYKIAAKTDSQLINKVVDIFVNTMPILKIENERLKMAISKRDVIISDLENKIADLQTKKRRPKK